MVLENYISSQTTSIKIMAVFNADRVLLKWASW